MLKNKLSILETKLKEKTDQEASPAKQCEVSDYDHNEAIEFMEMENQCTQDEKEEYKKQVRELKAKNKGTMERLKTVEKQLAEYKMKCRKLEDPIPVIVVNEDSNINSYDQHQEETMLLNIPQTSDMPENPEIPMNTVSSSSSVNCVPTEKIASKDINFVFETHEDEKNFSPKISNPSDEEVEMDSENQTPKKLKKSTGGERRETQHDSSVPGGSSEGSSIPKFVHGIGKYLAYKDKKILKATFEQTNKGDTVHGQLIKKGEGRFLITKVMKDANAYPNFDIDRHVVGSFILWSMSDVLDVKRKLAEKSGTEDLVPKMRNGTPKKKRDEKRWKRNMKKRIINAGNRYESTNKEGEKTIVKAKEMKDGCKNTNCRLKCAESFDEHERKEIFDAFYGLPSADEKRSFILRMTSRQQKMRERKRGEKKNTADTRNRQWSYKYKFADPNYVDLDTTVCQKMFLDTLGISKQMVETAHKKKIPGGGGSAQRDHRGKHGKQRKTDPAREATVVEHIMEFKVVESHYVRKSAKCQFLPSELNLQEMHRLYLEFCHDKGYKPENYDFYKRIFHRRFNLKFLKPKKDQCNKCETYKNIIKTPQIEKEQKKHLNDKEIVREYKHDHKIRAEANELVVSAAFDLEQVLLCPYGPTGAYYYSRRLKNHNLTITELDNMNTYAFLWNEHEAQKGSCEVTTGVIKFLGHKASEGKKEIHLYSDKCGGQNLNRMIFIGLAHAVKVYKFEFVELTYLVVGHSQNENDTAHSTIESGYRNKTILTTDQWECTIRNAFKKNNISIETLMHDDIIDFKSADAFPQYGDVLKDKCLDTGVGKARKVMWNSIVQIKFAKDNRTFIKNNYEDEYREIPFTNKVVLTRGGNKNDGKMGFECEKYKAPIGIAEAKKKDLLKMCHKNLIPKAHHAFYDRLIINSKVVDEDTVEEVELEEDIDGE